MKRIVDRNRSLRASDSAGLASATRDKVAEAFSRRTALLGRAIYLAVLSALITLALLANAFLAALFEVAHGRIVRSCL